MKLESGSLPPYAAPSDGATLHESKNERYKNILDYIFAVTHQSTMRFWKVIKHFPLKPIKSV